MEQLSQQRVQRNRTGQLSGVQIMFAAILAIGLILGLNFTNLVSTSQPLQQKYTDLQSEIQRLEQEQEALLKERDHVRSDAYVESWARDEGKLVRPGEVLVIPVPSAVEIQATPESRPEVQVVLDPSQPEQWELWWALFFDSPPPEF
jgi:cell division protein FtsB